MNKTIVKIFALLLVIVLLAVPVFAGGDQPNLPEEHEQEAVTIENTVIQPRAQQCSKCMEGSLNYSHTEYTSWAYVGNILYCKKSNAEHCDKWYQRTVHKYYKCSNSNCGLEDFLSSVQNDYRCP